MEGDQIAKTYKLKTSAPSISFCVYGKKARVMEVQWGHRAQNAGIASIKGRAIILLYMMRSSAQVYFLYHSNGEDIL